jgi:hypothetical protein
MELVGNVRSLRKITIVSRDVSSFKFKTFIIRLCKFGDVCYRNSTDSINSAHQNFHIYREEREA